MTEKLYYIDSHMKSFTARVLACTQGKKDWEVELDRTAFFPEGGGQQADTGTLGSVRVLDVREKQVRVIHHTDGPLEPGTEVAGEIDWPQRFQRMQNHSGEHIVSGTIHRLFGYDNVGFHMKPGEVTIDFDGELDDEQIRQVERLANEAVWRNLTVRAEFPSPEELAGLNYRSKLELTENVRIVTIDGVDVCACCAPHVSRTGEIGCIKILSHMRHRGGVRMTMVCGGEALEDYGRKGEVLQDISAMLSVKQLEAAAAVEKLKNELAELKFQVVKAARERAMETLKTLEPTQGNICLFQPGLDMESLRTLVNGALPLCGGICAGFTGGDGKWQYIMASQKVDLRAESKKINAALQGKGGGSPQMIQGSLAASEEEIRRYFRG